MVAINSKVFAAQTAAATSRAIDTLGGVQFSMTINVTAVGATPTATVALQGSPSIGSDAAWANLATPSTVTAVGVTYVTVTGSTKFLRVNVTADTNVTLDVWVTVGQQQPGAGLWISP